MHNRQNITHPRRRRCTAASLFLAFAAAGIAVLGGCAGYSNWRDGSRLVDEGHIGKGLDLMQRASRENPEQYRMRFIAARDSQVQSLMKSAAASRRDHHVDEALADYQEVLQHDPQNAEALRGITLIGREQRESAELDEARSALGKHDAASARQIVGAILSENPGQVQARQMLQQIDAQYTRSSMFLPTLNQSLQTPVTLELRDVDIRSVLAILTQTSGIGFVLDKDVSPDLRTTIYARNTTVVDALNLILQTSQLEMKILNDTTVLVYPSSEEKKKRYDDLVVRSYYLNSADPKKVQEMLRTVVAPKSMFVDDRLKMLVVRDTEAVQGTVTRLLDLYDIASPEVVLDVEVLEINENDLLNVGIQYPTTVSASMIGPAGVAGGMTIDTLRGLNRDSFAFTFPDPLAVLNLRQTSSNTRTLANPRIRVLNREKASVLIGDKVPVITSTVNQTSNAITESVNYLDVGLKLEVEPEIHIDNDVTMRVALEVSNIVKEVRSSATGLLAYQIGTRNANTVLRLHEGETQALAGLIKSDSQESGSHVPGLGKIPVLGRLFSNNSDTNTRSEIVLLITPHVARSLAMPNAYSQAFPSGTADHVSTAALRLTPAAQYSDSDNLPPPSATADKAAVPAKDAGSQAIAFAAASHSSDQGSAAQAHTESVRFELVVPSQVNSKSSFPVSLIASGHGFEKAEIDLVLDQPDTHLLKVSPRDDIALEAKQEGNTIHISIGKANATGPLGILTLQSDMNSSGLLNLSLQNPKAEKDDHTPLNSAVALPGQINIIP